MEKFVFRSALPQDADETAQIEQICFPPNEACKKEDMRSRVKEAPEEFLIAYDPENKLIAGFITGIVTNEESFSDAFFTDSKLHDPKGKNVMILGLEVRPEYRLCGLGRRLVSLYAAKEAEKGRERLVLTCHARLVKMYEKLGFTDLGLSSSVWGGEKWHEMERILN